MGEPRVAVVTGANRGIGLEIARQLARRGLRVVLTSRSAAKGRSGRGNGHRKGNGGGQHQNGGRPRRERPAGEPIAVTSGFTGDDLLRDERRPQKQERRDHGHPQNDGRGEGNRNHEGKKHHGRPGQKQGERRDRNHGGRNENRAGGERRDGGQGMRRGAGGSRGHQG